MSMYEERIKRNQIIANLAEQGLSLDEIAEELGYTRRTILQVYQFLPEAYIEEDRRRSRKDNSIRVIPVRREYSDRGRVRIVETGEVFDNAAALTRAINGNPNCVSRVLRGIQKKHLGLTFEYVLTHEDRPYARGIE